MESVNASQFPQVYEDLGIDTGELGCIMAATEPIEVSSVIPAEALYYSDDEEYAQGIVSESMPHVTLLYGLLASGPAMRKHVDAVLTGWSMTDVQVAGVEAWAQPDAEYACIVAKLIPGNELVGANDRLRLLPHIDTFPQFRPHITLAYVKNDPEAIEQYVDELNRRLTLRVVGVTGLDYGK